MKKETISITEHLNDDRERRVLVVSPAIGEIAAKQVSRKVPAAEYYASTEDNLTEDVFIVPDTELKIHQSLIVQAVRDQVVQPVEYEQL